MDDYIKKADAINALCKAVHKDDGVIPCENQTASCVWSKTRVCDYAREIDALPSADVVNKTDLLGWLFAYHMKLFELKGRYLPHEVIAWLVNDLSKDLFEDGEQDGSID